ncbi:NnrS family protein [Motiliproteus sediminis]|uniref:NnrS family protein n=1 Tax=Motiliproteus sediminis TaxID=1468178 RepID=UPI001AEF8611|nr:NnrS family protein [Motiliproteus sediminis]
MLQIDRSAPIPPDRNALLFLGFRPFFLLAGIAAIALIAVWLPHYYGPLPLNDHFAPVGWHGHEMLFGYAVAVIAGFLLTAVRNWTGQPMPTGWKLGVLVLIWLAGRILVSLDLGQPDWLTAAIDCAFLPAVMVALAPALIRAGKLRNMAFLVILAALTGANLLMHQQALGEGKLGAAGLQAGLSLVILVIVVMGGRVIPFFTRNPLPAMEPKIRPWVEFLAIALVIATLLGDLFALPPLLLAPLALVAGLVQLIRLSGWYDRRIWARPIIWVLHVAYAWIGIGFLLKAAALWQWVSPLAPTHAFTVGGIGLITLGMMGRVALGHTGRPLELPKLTVFAIILIAAMAPVRVLASLAPAWADPLLGLSALGWMLAFFGFVIPYTPILARPRIDGRPG